MIYKLDTYKVELGFFGQLAIPFISILGLFNAICWKEVIPFISHTYISMDLYLQSAGNSYNDINWAIFLWTNSIKKTKLYVTSKPFTNIIIISPSETIRITIVNIYNSIIYPLFNTVRYYGQPSPLTNPTLDINCLDPTFYDWLAGLIDCDGSFLVSKAGYTSCDITLHSSEVQALYIIRDYMGGSVKKRSGVNAYRYRLTRTDCMILLAK